MIANFNQLATTPLRKQALLTLEAGLSALAIEPIIQNTAWYDARQDYLVATGQKFSLRSYQHVILLGLGTGSLTAVNSLHKILGSRLTAGFVVDRQSSQLPNVLSRQASAGTSVTNQSIARELMALMEDCSDDDLIISVITSGSDLLAAPAGMTVEDKRAIINTLIESGASPQEIATVKKHLSLVKGGRLAKLAHPATMINLIFNDSGDLAVAMDGPTVPDLTSVHDAQAVLNNYNVLQKCGLTSCRLFETPKDRVYFERVNNLSIPIGDYAQAAMASKAKDLGFRRSKSPDPTTVARGEFWLGQTEPKFSVGQVPAQGVLLSFTGDSGVLLDSQQLATAKTSGLVDLAAGNWGETIDTFSFSDQFNRALAPLALYLRG